MFPSNLSIKAYSSSAYTDLLGSYTLQINPGSVICSYGKDDFEGSEPKSANGGAIPHKLYTYFKESVSFNFTLDLTGVIPSVPDGVGPSKTIYFSGLEDSIKKLKEIGYSGGLTMQAARGDNDIETAKEQMKYVKTILNKV